MVELYMLNPEQTRSERFPHDFLRFLVGGLSRPCARHAPRDLDLRRGGGRAAISDEISTVGKTT